MEFFSHFESTQNLEHFQKRMSLLVYVFPKLLIPKEMVLKRLKGVPSGQLSEINVFTDSTHCWNKNGTTINLFLNEYEVNWGGKRLRYSDLKSWDILLTHLLPMTSNYIAACRISRNNFKCKHLIKKTFYEFFIAFLKFSSNLQHSEKKRWVS